MNRREYNGWTNYETWLVNVWYGDVFDDMVANEGENVTAEYMQSFVEDLLESDGALPQYGFAADIMNAALREVDWEDIYDHYYEDAKEEEDA